MLVLLTTYTNTLVSRGEIFTVLPENITEKTFLLAVICLVALKKKKKKKKNREPYLLNNPHNILNDNFYCSSSKFRQMSATLLLIADVNYLIFDVQNIPTLCCGYTVQIFTTRVVYD